MWMYSMHVMFRQRAKHIDQHGDESWVCSPAGGCSYFTLHLSDSIGVK